jgi:predicted transcriptional regulator of viral defense system
MDDTEFGAPQSKYQRLFGVASGQQGYFTAAQARECGYGTDLLTYHTRTGKFIREQRGVYRLRDYPSSNRGWVVVAWLAAGKEDAVVSHESALDLLDLSDVTPNYTHITVPRSKRYLRPRRGVKIHTTDKPFRSIDVIRLDGLRVTSATRTILDAAEGTTQLEQVQLAAVEAVNRGMTTKSMLLKGAEVRAGWIRDLIDDAFRDIAA